MGQNAPGRGAFWLVLAVVLYNGVAYTAVLGQNGGKMDAEGVDRAFWERVEKGVMCWKWTGLVNGKGYGVFDTGHRLEYAHRYAYFALVGDIRPGQRLRKTCDNRLCVNPAHWSTDKSISNGTIEYKQQKQAKRGRDRRRKLPDTAYPAIYDAFHSQNVTQTALSVKYRVSQARISQIVNDSRWN